MPLCLLTEFCRQAQSGLGESSAKTMVSPVSTSDPRQNAQQAQEIQRQKQQEQDDARNIRKNQQPSGGNAQASNLVDQDNQNRANQNSQQVKGASLDIRA